MPCFVAALCLDPWDSPQTIAERFHFADPVGLVKANGLVTLAEYDGSLPLQIPGWYFFHSTPGDTLETFDELFGLKPGSCISAGKAFRPNPGMLYAGEIVAVPL